MVEGRTFGSVLKRVLLLLRSAPALDLVLLHLRSVLQKGHTVTGSSLDLDGFEGGLIPLDLFFPALFSPPRTVLSFG